MIKVTIDLTPNRHFCNIELNSVLYNLDSLGFTSDISKHKDTSTLKNHVTNEILNVESTGCLSLITSIKEINNRSLYTLINRCTHIIKNLQPYYKNELNDDTFYLYWPFNYNASAHNISLSDYVVKNYEIMDNLYSTVMHRNHAYSQLNN